MTRVLTVRIPPELLGRAEERAVQLGLDRAAYIRELIEQDLMEAKRSPIRAFASEDLVGKFRLGGKPATNQHVRERLKARARGK